MMRTPVGGVIVYPFALGTDVKAGDVIAEIIDPAADDPAQARTQIRALSSWAALRDCVEPAGAAERYCDQDRG